MCEDGEFVKGDAAPSLAGRTSVTGAFTRSYLLFDGEDDATFNRWAVVAASDLFVGKFTVTLGAGALFAGRLDTPEGTWQMDQGWLAAAGLSWRVLDGAGSLPYIVLSASLGGAGASTRLDEQRGDYYGLDFRFGATLGKTFAGWFSPYASLRAFGGPIFWFVEDELRWGTDKFHFQGALGTVFILPEGFDLFVEAQPGAEMGGLAGVGWRY